MVIRAFMFLTNKTLMNEIETKFEKSTLMLQWGFSRVSVNIYPSLIYVKIDCTFTINCPNICYDIL